MAPLRRYDVGDAGDRNLLAEVDRGAGRLRGFITGDVTATTLARREAPPGAALDGRSLLTELRDDSGAAVLRSSS